MEAGVVNRAACAPVGVVSRAACTPVAIRGGSKANGRDSIATWGQWNGHGSPETQRHGETVAGRGVAPMETEARPAAANTTQSLDSAWHRILPVTWQDGDSLGPAPGAAGNFTTKDTKNTKATVR